MKVADIMQRDVVTVPPKAKLKDVAKIIFGLQISGVPVVSDKKLVGLITETDLLRKLYPSYQEFMEDYVHAKDFEAMEELSDKILDLSAGDIMNKHPRTVTHDTPVMRVQSLMLTRGFGRVPVVDEHNRLLGVLSQGDIFRAVVGEKLPFEQEERFHDWLSRYWYLLVDWKTRLAKEIPDLTALFKKEGVTRILDIGCGTGEHDIALAEAGFYVVGVDLSTRMISVANAARAERTKNTRERVQFSHLEYENLSKVFPEKFDAVISMGSVLAHSPKPAAVLKHANTVLNKKAVVVCQMTNFGKVLRVKRRFFDFQIRGANNANEPECAFLQYYDSEEKGFLTLNIAVFVRGKTRWTFKGMHATPVAYLHREKLKSLIEDIGFEDISFFGAEGGFYYDYLFREPFNPLESDTLIVVGKRG